VLQIARNVEILQTSAGYRDFLWKLCPDDVIPIEYRCDPKVLVEEMGRAENETLFIIGHYNRLGEIVEASIAPFNHSLELTRQQEQIAEELLCAIDKIEECPGALLAEQEGELEVLDDELPGLQLPFEKHVQLP
jgi:hypothetical protein